MEVPKFLLNKGKGRYVVDVGLGEDMQETLAAVKKGFVVFAFEPLPGNIAAIRRMVESASPELYAKIHFPKLRRGPIGGWVVDPPLPRPPPGQGFAYVFAAGVSEKSQTMYMPQGRGSVFEQLRGNAGGGSVEVPVVTLDDAVPRWAEKVELMKIDTQGYELHVLKGALKSVAARRYRYILYEFSPWLMRKSHLGDPWELLSLLPNMGALCFDMMGTHNKLPRPSAPLEEYYKRLDGGQNSMNSHSQLSSDGIGPWDDIMCMWPE